jgi:hypothetical protein
MSDKKTRLTIDKEGDNFEDEQLGEDFENLYQANEVGDYETALEVALAALSVMVEEARNDVILLAVGEYGAMQVIGTGKHFPPNVDTLVQGPCVLVYGKDARAALAERLKTPPVDAPDRG